MLIEMNSNAEESAGGCHMHRNCCERACIFPGKVIKSFLFALLIAGGKKGTKGKHSSKKKEKTVAKQVNIKLGLAEGNVPVVVLSYS